MNVSFKWIAASLLFLGLVTFFLGDKTTTSSAALSLSFSEFDEIMLAPVAQISAVELAEYLMKQEHHYNLIDLQSSEINYRIPTAEPATVDEFLLREIPINETIILYSEYETSATQLYYLLLIRGYFKVKVLTGGVDQWNKQILQPSLYTTPIDQQPLRKKLTEFFGGSFNQNKVQLVPKIINIEKKSKCITAVKAQRVLKYFSRKAKTAGK